MLKSSSKFPVLVLVSLSTLLGCASQASQKTESPKRKSTEEEPAPRTSDTQGEGSGKAPAPPIDGNDGCGGLSLYKAGRGTVDGRNLIVYTGRDKQTKSFCDVIADSGKPVAIFQFAGSDCISCQDEAAELTRILKAHPKGGKIAQVVVLTDFFEDVRDTAFTSFKQNYAPSGIVVFDEAKLWKKFSADPSMPNRGTIMAMSASMETVVINHPEEDANPDAAKSAQAILDAALSLIP